MTHKEWELSVRHALVDRGEKVSHMARELDWTPAWIYLTLSGKEPHQNVVDRISEYVGVEPYRV